VRAGLPGGSSGLTGAMLVVAQQSPHREFSPIRALTADHVTRPRSTAQRVAAARLLAPILV